MHLNLKKLFVLLLAACAAMTAAIPMHSIGFLPLQAATPAANQSDDQPALLEAFAALQPIDTHVHAFKTDPQFSDLMTHLHLNVLDICVPDTHGIYGQLDAEIARAKAFIQANQSHARLCVTFDPFAFNRKDFARKTVEQLRQEFNQGAIAVKIWKNIGMELKTPDGKYVMPDDPGLEPIYRAIADDNKTLVAHVAEPSSCWQAPNPESPDYSYYKENPQWYMYLHPDHPRKEVILAARDHLLAENPKLRVVGAHLGSMETDVDEIAKRFDRYPNFAVDTAARMEYLMIQPRDKVRNFLIKYQTRVLYGTDLEFLTDENTAEALKDWQETYARDWKFLATNETFEYNGRKVQGLDLPPSVLRRIYHDNAVQWIPGIVPFSK